MVLGSRTRWGGTENYTYDVLGNLTAKAGVPFSYPQLPAAGGPHAPNLVNGVAYSYDANGNYLNGGAGSAAWNTDNQPTSLTANGLTEQFTYDADGERLSRTHGGLTTYYIGDWLEYDVQGGAIVAVRYLFRFNGQVVATNTPTQWVFLLADHLGSTSVVADAANTVINTQDFDPWGAIRRGSAAQTSVNYTGQRRDDTGLLYYHSRYYNPATAHFLSADTLASMGFNKNTAVRSLAVNYNVRDFVARLNSEDAFTQQKGFWFQLGNQDRRQAKDPWGPRNPQVLNRYSYVLNNPMRNTDPTGCSVCFSDDQAEAYAQAFEAGAHWVDAYDAAGSTNLLNYFGGILAGIAATIIAHFVPSPIAKALILGIGAAIGGASAWTTLVLLADALRNTANAIRKIHNWHVTHGVKDGHICVGFYGVGNAEVRDMNYGEDGNPEQAIPILYPALIWPFMAAELPQEWWTSSGNYYQNDGLPHSH